jgi:AsmA protein
MGAFSTGFKLLLKFLFLCLAIVIIAPIGLFFIFNTSDFKPQVSEALSKYTGHQITINGEIKTNFWPWIGLDVQDVQISQPQNFGDGYLAQAKSLGLKMPVKSLLQWKFDIDTLKIEQLNLNLIKNTNGKFNWESVNTDTKDSNIKTTALKNEKESKQKSKAAKDIKLSLNNIELSNCAVKFHDAKQNISYKINNINLSGENFSTLAAPLSGKMNVYFIDHANKNSNWQAQAGVKGQLDLSKLGNLSFESDESIFSWKKVNKQAIDATISGKIQVNPEIIDASDLKLTSMGSTVTGWAKIPHSTSDDINFYLHSNKINLQNFANLAANGEQMYFSENDYGTHIEFASSTQNKQQKAVGNIEISHLLYNKLDLYKVTASAVIDSQGIKLNPISANGYSGHLRAAVNQSWAKGAPTKISGQLKQIDIKNLLTDLYSNQKVSGKLDSSFDISLHPANGLNGTIKNKIYNGILNGVDIRYYFGQADSLIRKKPNTETNRKMTPFGNLNATFIARNNVLSNQDLHLTNNDFYANGEGIINLNSQTLNYKIKARRHKDNDNNLPLAIKITGPIDDPNIQPDLDEYVKTLIERELKGNLEDQVGKILGNDKTPDGTNQGIDNKIEKEINRGLKKLFKF